ncbi:hypothetical protein BGZ92_006983 [Podila epicladia]|nr:hypothetical protein BGZ92_006983 [Podila epicladia]
MDPKPSSNSTSDHPASHLEPVHKTHDELMHMHPHELLQILDERHIDHKGCFEKEELVQLILDKCSK